MTPCQISLMFKRAPLCVEPATTRLLWRHVHPDMKDDLYEPTKASGDTYLCDEHVPSMLGAVFEAIRLGLSDDSVVFTGH